MRQIATWGPHYWPWAIIACVLIIMVPEIYALATNVQNSLTYYSHAELNVGPNITRHTAAWVLSLGMVLTLEIWLDGHIWFNLWMAH